MNLFNKLTEKPWLEPGLPDAGEHSGDDSGSAKKVALNMFLAVVTSIFFLFIMAYLKRMQLADWYPVDEPGLLWVNTVFLILGSIAMQRARRAAALENRSVRGPLLIGGMLAVLFLVGQFLAWGVLRADGYYAVSNPANSFFYLLTAVHGIHLLGGLYVWARTMKRCWRGVELAQIRLSVELCSVYWHYLLLVWLVLFALMLNT